MKRIVAGILLLCLVAGLFACGKKEESKFLVGYAREDITPLKSMPLAGYGNTDKRMSETVLDKLYVSCVAITDTQGETVLLLSLDTINSSQTSQIRKKINEATGIPEDRIMVAATHTHSAPDQSSKLAASFAEALPIKAMAAAKAALADRAESEIYSGSVDAEGLNFVRHYELKDGTYCGDNFGTFDINLAVGHAEENDPQMQLIKFVRGEDKKNIIMVNWQAHPCITGAIDKTDISADFIGSTRDYVEQKTKDHFIYFTGAAGNQNTKSKLPNETPTTDYRAYAVLLGDYVLKGLESLSQAQSGTLKTTQTLFTGKIDRTGQEKRPEAELVVAEWRANGRDAGNKLAKQYGLSSVYHASAIVSRIKMADTRDLEINAITVGDISFVTAPYEMFAAHGRAIKDGAPAKTTFVLSCCNGANSYIPTNKAYDYGCYESYVGYFQRGTGDQLVETFLAMLKAQSA